MPTQNLIGSSQPFELVNRNERIYDEGFCVAGLSEQLLRNGKMFLYKFRCVCVCHECK